MGSQVVKSTHSTLKMYLHPDPSFISVENNCTIFERDCVLSKMGVVPSFMEWYVLDDLGTIFSRRGPSCGHMPLQFSSAHPPQPWQCDSRFTMVPSSSGVGWMGKNAFTEKTIKLQVVLLISENLHGCREEDRRSNVQSSSPHCFCHLPSILAWPHKPCSVGCEAEEGGAALCIWPPACGSDRQSHPIELPLFSWG